jgi:phenylalanyl-tRNA synthetase beta chain
MHECDILEDIAICYGYQKVNPTLPPSSTIGSQLRINKFVDLLRHELAQGQFDEALNFALCSKADLTSNIFNTDDSKLITIENAKTKEFQTGRTTLLPGLLRTIIENKSTALPFKLFEAGDCIILDETTDTGSRNVKKIAAVYTDEVNEKTKKNLFSMIHGLMDVVLKKCNLEFGKDYHLEVSESKFFFPGQQFEVILKDKVIGSLGVVHPLVVKNFGWYHPTVMW